MKCVFCKKAINGWGNNPAPASFEGECCDECNYKIVLPARLENLNGYYANRTKKEGLK